MKNSNVAYNILRTQNKPSKDKRQKTKNNKNNVKIKTYNEKIMTEFIKDEASQKMLETLKQLAEQKERMITLDAIETSVPHDQTITLPSGWLITFTIEETLFGLARHVLITNPEKEKIPEYIIQWVKDQLGFLKPNENNLFYMERDVNKYILNVIEFIHKKEIA